MIRLVKGWGLTRSELSFSFGFGQNGRKKFSAILLKQNGTQKFLFQISRNFGRNQNFGLKFSILLKMRKIYGFNFLNKKIEKGQENGN